MRRCTAPCFAVALMALVGCGRESTINCEPVERYSTARSTPPVQIPDDLSPPNESDALRLPPVVGARPTLPNERCLESPPAFSGESAGGAALPPESGAGPATGERLIEN